MLAKSLKAVHILAWADFNPRPTKPFFVTWFTKGDGYHPPYELEIDEPKV